MRIPISTLVQELAAAQQAGAALVLLFDYDGTLVPFADHPDAATLTSRTRQLLKRMARKPRVHVGVLSGRAIDDLSRRIRVPQVYLAGTGGLELRLMGTRLIHPRSRDAAILVAQVVRTLQSVTALFARAWVEDKCLSCTVHYRSVDPGSVGALRARVVDALRPWADRLTVLEGPLALEIAPDLGWDKGTAVRMILERVGAKVSRVLFAGDGDNDAPAYRVVAELQGATIGVGAAAPATAQYRLPDPAALLACLATLYGMLGDRRDQRRQSNHLPYRLKRYRHA